MPSSTSSSRPKGRQPSWADQRIPNDHWLKCLGLIGVVFLAGLTFFEVYGRSLGFVPSLRDNAGLWSMNRDKATGDVLAIVGSSRAQLGLDLDAMKHRSNRADVVQLSINGSSSLLVLEDLADDPHFTGSVMMEINPIYFFFTDQDPTHSNRAAQKLAAHQNASAWQPIEQRLLMASQSRFVFGLPQMAPQHLLKKWAAGKQPEPDIFTLRADRWRRADYDSLSDSKKADLAKRQRKYYIQKSEFSCADTLPELVNRMKNAVTKIKKKGGQVSLFRMPSSGEILERELARCPKAECWEALLAEVGLPAIHFSEISELSDLELADESHVDQSDSRALTTLFSDALQQQGFEF